MFMTELDNYRQDVRSQDSNRRGRRYTRADRRRSSASSSASSSADEASSYATAANSPQRLSSSGSGLRVNDDSNRSESLSRGNSRRRMASSSTITAAAAARYQSSDGGASTTGNWSGGNLQQTDMLVDPRELAGLDAELRRPVQRRLPRDGRWAIPGEREALKELAAFLRNVSPPPGHMMSLPDPTSPTATLSSVASSLRRHNSIKMKKRSPLRLALGLFRRSSVSGSKKKGLWRKRSVSQLQRERSVSSLNTRGKTKRRRPPRIKLPDTAVAGTTTGGFRHIAISIPIEHAHLSPGQQYRFPSPNARRTRSYSPPERRSSDASRAGRKVNRNTMAPKIYQDVNVRPMSAFVTASDSRTVHVGTQLGPLVEERESLSSRSWEKNNNPSITNSASDEVAAARRVHLASRHTFGTVHEEHLAGLAASPGATLAHDLASPERLSEEESSGGPRTPRTSDEVRSAAHKLALAALAGGIGSSPPSQARPSTSSARPTSGSAYSFRSFATPSPGPKAQQPHPVRPSLLPGTSERGGRGRVRSNSDRAGFSLGHYSRDSSRGQTTVLESIFSEGSYLESLDTVETADHDQLQQQVPTPGSVGVVSEAKAARRVEGAEVVVHDGTARRSMDGKRSSTGSGKRISVGSAKRTSSGSAVSTSEQDRHGESQDEKPQRRFMLTNPGRSSGSSGLGGLEEEKDVQLGQGSGSNSASSDPDVDALGTGKEAGEPRAVSRPRTPVDGRHQGVSVMSRPVTPERRPRSRVRAYTGTSTPPKVTLSRSSSVARSGEEAGSKSPTSPLPSPKERREKRKTILLSRKQRFAELKKALDQPGTQPKDLVWERSLSVSSSSSNESTPKANKDTKTDDSKRNTISHPAEATSLTPTKIYRPQTVPPSLLSLTQVFTIADLRPSSPERFDLTRKDSIPVSLSSPTTTSTVLKASPIPPFRGLGSVTPPDSPHSFGSPSPPVSPPFYSPDEQRTPLRHPHPIPLKRINSRSSRHSGRVSPSSPASPSSTVRRSPSLLAVRGASPLRPKTAGKGALASKRDYFMSTKLAAATVPNLGRQHSSESLIESASNMGSPEQQRQQQKSLLKMTRSEIFERYEVLRERQARDMEKRVRRLERNGEQWLTSVLPLLSDLSQTLGRLAEGKQDETARDHAVKDKGKGKEVERPKTWKGRENGRQSRFSNRSDDDEEVVETRRPRTYNDIIERQRWDNSLDLDREELNPARYARRSAPARATNVNSSSSVAGPARPHGKRLYLQDSPMLHPDLGYRVDTRSFTDDGRSLSLSAADAFEGYVARPRYRKAHTTFVAPEGAVQQRQHSDRSQRPISASTTMVGSTAGRASSLLQQHMSQKTYQPQQQAAKSVYRPMSPSELREEDLERAERLSQRVEASMRRLSLGLPATPPHTMTSKSPAGLDEERPLPLQRRQHRERGGGGPVERNSTGFERSLWAPGVARRFSDESVGPRSDISSSLETYDGSSTDREGDEGAAALARQMRRAAAAAARGQGALYIGGSGSSGGGGGRRRSGMETIEPLMRELQATGSRLSLESSSSGGDAEVRRMREGPGPRAVVGFGAFSM